MVGGGSPYATIQQGIAAAERAGSHTVLVSAGAYTENDVIGAADDGLTIATVSGGVTLAGSISLTDAANVTISGLTFQGDGSTVAITSLGGQALTVTQDSFAGTGQAVMLDRTTDSTLSVAARNDVRLDAQSRPLSGAHWVRLESASDARCLRMSARSVRRMRDWPVRRTIGEIKRTATAGVRYPVRQKNERFPGGRSRLALNAKIPPGNQSRNQLQHSRHGLSFLTPAICHYDRPELTNWASGTHKQTKLERPGCGGQTFQGFGPIWVFGRTLGW